MAQIVTEETVCTCSHPASTHAGVQAPLVLWHCLRCACAAFTPRDA